jgi:hypothetical protein
MILDTGFRRYDGGYQLTRMPALPPMPSTSSPKVTSSP